MARSLAALTLALSLGAAALAGCGSTEEVASDDRTPTGSGGAAAASFPVTVEHKFGETTVESEPSQVVVVGLTEQDTLLQLGVVPVATTEWYGEQPGALWPWARELLEELDGEEPEVLDASDGIPFEQVAALAPDLVVATNAGLTERDYELLDEIAPTVTSVEGSTQFFSSWRDQTRQIAAALGRSEDGEELIAEVEDGYAAVAAEHPEWEGRSATFSQGGPYDGQLYVYPDGLSTDFLTDLGFVIDPALDDFVPEAGSQAIVSAENVNLLDADLVVWATEDQEMFEELQAFSTVDRLDAVVENRSVYTDDTLAGAIYFDTPLAHLYLLDRLVPMIELAAEGEAPRALP